jgi:hypothetical protein
MLVKLLKEFGTVPVKELVWSRRTVNLVRDPMEEYREPVKELEKSSNTLNEVRDPIDKGRGPLKELTPR